MEVAVVFIALFVIVFGIFYLHYSTRNKERLSLIEKGADASIFFSAKEKRKSAPVGKIIILNLAVLLMGVGVGVFLGTFLEAYTQLDEGPAYSGSVFLMAGLGLFIGFMLTRKLIDKDDK